MSKEQILVIDDDDDILELIKYNLNKEGYRVECVKTGEEGLKIAEMRLPHLIILDLMLPNIDGLEVCRRLRANSKTLNIPVIMLTAKGEETDIVAGLELGADDYIAKPFSPKILVARIRVILRRRAEKSVDETSSISIHNLVIHPGRHEVIIDGRRIDLTLTEFRLLNFLARRPGWVFTRYQIVDALHGDDYPVTDRSVDVQVVGLRKKLGKSGKYIETVRGVGYRFRE